MGLLCHAATVGVIVNSISVSRSAVICCTMMGKIREAFEKRSGWLHGMAPSWLPWRPRVIAWAAQSLAAAVEAGGLRDAGRAGGHCDLYCRSWQNAFLSSVRLVSFSCQTVG